MSEDHNDYTRRQLLQATVGAGILGAGTGAVTGAYLSDTEVFPENPLRTSSFTLELATKTDGGDEFRFHDSSAVSIDLPELEPGDAGIVRTGYRICEASGWIWVRPMTNDSSGAGRLTERLDVRVLERPGCGDVENEHFEGVLTEFIDRYDDGLQLGDECISCEPACLDLEWEYNAAQSAHVPNESTSLSLEFAAAQCRHHENHPESPWT